MGLAEDLRNPDAHRRELAEFQKSLVVGISGYLRTAIMLHRNSLITNDPDEVFPRIESVRDSFATAVLNPSYHTMAVCERYAYPGDEVEIRVSSFDPLGGTLSYSIDRIGHYSWSESPSKVFVFEAKDIGRHCDVNVCVSSERDYHAMSHFDDVVTIRYVVLPRPSNLSK